MSNDKTTPVKKNPNSLPNEDLPLDPSKPIGKNKNQEEKLNKTKDKPTKSNNILPEESDSLLRNPADPNDKKKPVI